MTYIRICADYRPNKTDPYHVHATVGGNMLNYDGPVKTPCADTTTFKLFLNSVISTPNARFLDIDNENFYLESHLPDPEYMLIPYNIIPDDIKEEYNLEK